MAVNIKSLLIIPIIINLKILKQFIFFFLLLYQWFRSPIFTLDSFLLLLIQADTFGHLQKTIFQDSWTCIPDKNLQTHNTIATLKDCFIYRKDMFNPHSRILKNVKLRGWLHDMKHWSSSFGINMEYEESRVRVSYNIATDPPYSRPLKPANGCPVWYYEVLSNRSVRHIPKCPVEKGKYWYFRCSFSVYCWKY